MQKWEKKSVTKIKPLHNEQINGKHQEQSVYDSYSNYWCREKGGNDHIEEKKQEEFKAVLEIFRSKEKRWQNIVALGLFEAEMPTKQQKRSSSINGKKDFWNERIKSED